jgi:tRNA modification GTPase
MSDTIAAISTGMSVSAIGIIRLSGDDAIKIAGRVFRPKGLKNIEDAEDRKLILGNLLDTEGNIIDICLCTLSRAPHSYTGENTAEFQCHGSPIVLAEALKSLFKAGARQATRGEFTKRAFLNGCMDLTQAEAVIDLIEAETSFAARNAASQLGNSIGGKISEIYDSLLDIMSHFHAVIDYPDEDIDDFNLKNYTEILNKASDYLRRLLSTFDRGQIMKDGVPCAIIGRPNTGKSSLLNTLVGYERAIVTNIAGTTRDIVEEKVRIGNTVLRLADTAGIRNTDDVVESIGVSRALDAASSASLVIAVFDGSRELEEGDMHVLEAAKGAGHLIAVINKSDLPQLLDEKAIIDSFQNVFHISAKQGDGIEELCSAIGSMFSFGDETAAGEILTNIRQAEAVEKALASVNGAISAMDLGITPDAVLTEVEGALSALGELTGKYIRDDIVSRIFERFCVGK